MFVRWKRRFRQRVYDGSDFYSEWVKYAVLCKSERVNGKPQQKFIAHLGNIPEDNLEREADLFQFWKQSRPILNWIRLYPDRYGLASEEVTLEVIQKIIHQIEEIIPALSQEQMRAHFIRIWGSDCRAARREVEDCFFLKPDSLEEEGTYTLDRTSLRSELVNVLQSVVSK